MKVVKKKRAYRRKGKIVRPHKQRYNKKSREARLFKRKKEVSLVNSLLYGKEIDEALKGEEIEKQNQSLKEKAEDHLIKTSGGLNVKKSPKGFVIAKPPVNVNIAFEVEKERKRLQESRGRIKDMVAGPIDHNKINLLNEKLKALQGKSWERRDHDKEDEIKKALGHVEGVMEQRRRRASRMATMDVFKPEIDNLLMESKAVLKDPKFHIEQIKKGEAKKFSERQEKIGLHTGVSDNTRLKLRRANKLRSYTGIRDYKDTPTTMSKSQKKKKDEENN